MKQIHGVRISHQTIINYVNGVSALVKDMIIITDYSIKLNTSKAKNDFDALIKFRKLYSDLISSFSLSSVNFKQSCTGHLRHGHLQSSVCKHSCRHKNCGGKDTCQYGKDFFHSRPPYLSIL